MNPKHPYPCPESCDECHERETANSTPRTDALPITKGQWTVEPDQLSHGRCLCIVSGSQVIARTPECDAYGAPEQAIDEANAAAIARLPDLLRDRAALRAALETISAMSTTELLAAADMANVANRALAKVQP